MTNKKFDFGIIGAGPAGYTAAIRASQLGKSVVLFEKEFLGGTCLNKGCIPTKAFLRSADAYKELKKISNLGINVESYSLDFEKVADRKTKTVEKIRKSLEMLLKSYEIEIVNLEAKIVQDGNKIKAGEEIYGCNHILVATGANPKCVGGFEFDHEFILSSDDVLELKTLPQKVVIVGSGAIGTEWARIFSAFGAEVTVVEIADKLLPLADLEISERLARTFKMSKIKMFLSTSVKEIKDKKVILSSGEILEPDFVLFATGRGINDIGSETVANKIGDCSGGIQLAHFASHQAVAVVENIVLGKEIKDFLTPAVVYGHPEIAWVGKCEQELLNPPHPNPLPEVAREEYKKSVFPLSALGKAQCDGDLEGFVKILADNDGKILGAHIIGAEASALIHQLSIAMEGGIKVDELKHFCFAHPTYSEGVHEALLGLDNESLSLLSSKG